PPKFVVKAPPSARFLRWPGLGRRGSRVRPTMSSSSSKRSGWEGWWRGSAQELRPPNQVFDQGLILDVGFVLDGLPPLALLFLHVGAVLGCAGEADVVGDHDRSRMQPAPVDEPLQVVEVDVLPVVEEYEIQTALGESVVLGENLERRPVVDGAVNAGDAIGEAGVRPHAARYRGVGAGLFDREYVGARCRPGDPQPAVSAVGTEFHGELRVRALDGGVQQLALLVADVHQDRLVVGELVAGFYPCGAFARRCIGNDVVGHRFLPAVTHLTRSYDGRAAESPAQERVPQEGKLLPQRPTEAHCTET